MHTCPDIQSDNTLDKHPEWLQIIFAVNEVLPGTFLDPDSVGNDATGRYVEEYPAARVIFPPEDERFTPGATVQIMGKTPKVDGEIAAAARRLGFTA